jgi:ABC-type sugar transport system substrate-binding protein
MTFWRRLSLTCATSLALVQGVAAQSVVFLNPGKSDEVHWVSATQSMQAAAKSLGIALEVQYAERNHLRALDLARAIATRPQAQRPDYAVFANDYATGAALLGIFDGTGIKTFMAFSRLTREEEAVHGTARKRFKDWVGSLEPVADDAGYLTAKTLIAKGRALKLHGPDKKLHMLAVAGDRSTTSSILRNEGMMRAVAEAPDVLLDQIVFAAWNRDKAFEQADALFERHPGARLVWAGNDLMAFGAMAAAEKRGLSPGKDMVFSGVNASHEGMEAVRSGRLAALAGGHFITGAWALVMIHDHFKGRDFIDEGLQLERNMFVLFDTELANAFERKFAAGYGAVDFRRQSKALNPRLQRYDFGFAQLLR